jgi:AcrR family transcriptional regulator
MSSVVGTRRANAASRIAAESARPGSASRVLSAGVAQRPTRRRPSAAALGGAYLTQPSAPAEPHALPAEVQRNRIVMAAIRSLEEVGYTHASVAHITSRARVSRRTFYQLFADREACLLAAFEDVVALIERDLAGAGLDGLPWRERLRVGLWTILCFMEREPAMASVCVVQLLQGGAGILERREALLARLAEIVDEGRVQSAKAAQATPLTAEALVGAALSIVCTRLLREQREPLTDLLGELMGLIVLPYLGPAAARREQTRPAPATAPGQGAPSAGEQLAGDPFAGISMRLTYRTMRVLECVAATPGASNRRVGAAAGVPDQGQISKLLARLERLGLLENTGKSRPKGEANAWELTARGLQVTQTLCTQTSTSHGGGHPEGHTEEGK